MFYDLEVNVGQETFFVNKEILASFSNKLHKLFSKSASGKRERFKVIFNDFPGGVEGFELFVKFCYNKGRINVSPSNAFLLHFSAKFMELNEDPNMNYFQSLHSYTWFEFLDCLKHCQEWLSILNSPHILQEILEIMVEKISMHNIYSPVTFSSSSIGNTSSNSSSSNRSSNFQTVNWMQDLEFLNIGLFEKVVETMISNNLDRQMISSFLLHYQKVRFTGLSQTEKHEFISVFISLVDESFNIPFRNLCGVLHASRALKIDESFVKKLERLIGSQLDEATVDDVLVPSPSKERHAYDVNLMVRLLEVFLRENYSGRMFLKRLRKIGSLMDLYLAEVAPDPHLRPIKFLELVCALPDFARESYDKVYAAVNLYFEVHICANLEEKIKICSALNYAKLSSQALLHLGKNHKFPTCASAIALVFLNSKPSNLSEFNENIVQLRCNSSLRENEDEKLLIRLQLKGKKCRKYRKRSAKFVNCYC